MNVLIQIASLVYHNKANIGKNVPTGTFVRKLYKLSGIWKYDDLYYSKTYYAYEHESSPILQYILPLQYLLSTI